MKRQAPCGCRCGRARAVGDHRRGGGGRWSNTALLMARAVGDEELSEEVLREVRASVEGGRASRAPSASGPR